MSGRVLIDTSAYSALIAGSTAVAGVLAESEAVLLSPIVVGELLDGSLGGTKERENRRQLRRKGTTIPINDVWIAATCMEHGAALLSFDGHFREIDGLRVVAMEAL